MILRSGCQSTAVGTCPGGRSFSPSLLRIECPYFRTRLPSDSWARSCGRFVRKPRIERSLSSSFRIIFIASGRCQKATRITPVVGAGSRVRSRSDGSRKEAPSRPGPNHSFEKENAASGNEGSGHASSKMKSISIDTSITFTTTLSSTGTWRGLLNGPGRVSSGMFDSDSIPQIGERPSRSSRSLNRPSEGRWWVALR